MSRSFSILRPLDTPHKRRDHPELDAQAWWIVENGRTGNSRPIITTKAHGPYALPEEVDAALAQLEGRDTQIDPTCALCATGEEPGHEH